MTKVMSFDELLQLIHKDPIAGAKAARKRDVGVREGNYESSVSAGALYREFKKSPALCTAFYSLPFWVGGNAKNPAYLNKHCHKFVYGARDGIEGKRAEDHAYATQKYLDDEEKSLEHILAALKAGGFDGLRKAPTRQNTQAQGKEVDGSGWGNHVHSDPDDKGETETDSSGGSDDPPKRPVAAPPLDEKPKKSWPRIPLKQVFEHLLVTLNNRELSLFLDKQSKVGDTFKIILQRDRNALNGMLVWRAIDIETIPMEDDE